MIKKTNGPEITLITPMYNEAEHINENINMILDALETLEVDWEYILVDDGSTDDSYLKAKKALADRPNCRIIHYDINRGRGYALRQGFAIARGEYIITTESDLSWGPDIIEKLYQALKTTKTDIVIASVNLPEGGLVNVPIFRIALSRGGNWVMRRAFGGNLTMLSGMTRGYRREVIKSLYLEENGKEVHLEIIARAQALGYIVTEIPATIRWKPLAAKSKSKNRWRILGSILPHILLSLHVGSVKLLGGVAVTIGTLGALIILFGVLNKLFPGYLHPMPYLVTYGLLFVVLSLLFSLFALISLQLSFLYRNMVHIQSELKLLKELGE